MPLVFQQNINEATKLGVWHLAETEDFFLKKVPLQKEITHPHKRLQHLAGRYLLKVLFEDFPLDLIKIADTKKPFLENEAYHFSISHCGDYAAVIASSINRVGVDIETVTEKVVRIKNKFLSAIEQESIGLALNSQHPVSDTQLITFAWSIKEAMFKWYGSGAVDFKEHMHILTMGVSENDLLAECKFLKEMHKELIVRGTCFDGVILAWTLS